MILCAVYFSRVTFSERVYTDLFSLVVVVVCNDLTKEDVDAIVNAANGHLEHAGGVRKLQGHDRIYVLLIFF